MPDTPKKKGIVDPWRIVEPLKPPSRPVPTTKKIDPRDVDFDEDLRLTQFYVFRSDKGSVEVATKNIESPSDALQELVLALFEILALPGGAPLLSLAQLGMSLGAREYNVPQTLVGSASLKTPEAYTPSVALHFLNQPYNHGMLRLVKLFNTVQRRPDGVAILRRRGITQLMR